MNAMLRRVFEAARCKTQTELAVFLGIRQSSVSDAKRRQVVPAEWLIILLQQKSIHPDWIRTGKGARFLLPAEDAADNAIVPQNTAKDNSLMNFSTRELAEEVARRLSKTHSSS